MQMLDDSLFDFLHMEIVNLLAELDVSKEVAKENESKLSFNLI